MALAFSGSGPTVQNAGFYQNKSAGSTPQGNALNQAQTGIPFVHAAATPTTPVKSVTTTDPQGNTKAVTYHAQATPQTGTNPGMITPTTNADGSFTASDGSYHAANSPEAQNNKTMGSNATPPVQTPPPAPTGTPFANTVNAGVGASANSYGQGTSNVNSGTGMTMNAVNNPNSNIATAQNGLLDIAQNQTPEVKNAQGEFANFSKANPYLVGNVGNNVAAEVASGRGQILGNELGKEQEALAQNVQNALQGQGQQITAGTAGGGQALTQQGNAITGGTNIASTGTTQQGAGITGLGTQAGLIKPEANASYFGSPLSGDVVGGGNNLISTNVQQALQLVQNGASVNDPQVAKLLSISPQAQQAFNSAMLNGGTYNPTNQAATAGQNAAQSVNYQQQATDLDTQIKNLDNVSTLATNFLGSKDFLNPNEVPDINAGIGTYIGKFIDPAAKLQYNAIIGDISKFTSSILSTNTGQIPTAVTQQLQSFDPSTLNKAQLIPYLQTLKELGGNQLSVLQSQQNNSANQGSGAYTGTPTSVNTEPVATPKSTVSGGSQITNPYVQAAIGTGLNLWNGATAIIGGLATKLFGML